MSDILIRGMEMPQNCMACSEPYAPFSMHRKCYVDGHVFYYSYVHGRDKDCPLLELPPHGDLISKDEAMNAILGEPPEAHYPVWYAGIVSEIPAIVPGNKEETE